MLGLVTDHLPVKNEWNLWELLVAELKGRITRMWLRQEIAKQADMMSREKLFVTEFSYKELFHRLFN